MNKREKEAMLMQEFSKACYQLETAGIKIGTVTKVSINTRATNRWGRCVTRNGKSEIEISDLLFQSTNDGLIQTIIHELLHTIAPKDHHGGQWAVNADKMNRLYGYRIKNGDSFADVGVEENIREERAKYKIVCDKCGHVFTYQRAGKVVQHPEFYKCGCGGKLHKA